MCVMFLFMYVCKFNWMCLSIEWLKKFLDNFLSCFVGIFVFYEIIMLCVL